MVVEIAVNVPAAHTFHYAVPAALKDVLRVGHVVQVPFGPAVQWGVVVSLADAPPPDLADIALKPVDELLSAEPMVSAAQVALARWMAHDYVSSLSSALAHMLPVGFKTNTRERRFALADARASATDMLSHRLITLLQRRGALRLGQIVAALDDTPREPVMRALDALVDAGHVRADVVYVPPRLRNRRIDLAELAILPSEIDAHAPSLGRRNRRADVLEGIAALPAAEAPYALRLAETLLGTTRATLRKMADDGLLTIDDAAGTVALAAPRDKLDAALIDLRGATPHIHALRVLAREGGPVDVSWVYAQTGLDANALKKLEEAGLVALRERTEWDNPADAVVAPLAAPPVPSPDQAAAIDAVTAALDGRAPATFLLHGVTGSGKTEVYLRAAAHALGQGRGVLLLVPEIALTPQTVARVKARFGPGVVVLHSSMADGARYDAWARVQSGAARLVVGPRSAIFAPMRAIGLIVLDEEHDASYKHAPSDVLPAHRSGPHYHARAVAEHLAGLHQAVVLLGSATPSLESAYRARRGEITLLRLARRVVGHKEVVRARARAAGVLARYTPATDAPDALTMDLPPVTLVDMRAELHAGNTGMFSTALHDALAHTLARGEQAILFLNRRGLNTYVFCRDCGYVAVCPNCDAPLTYHADGTLHCHRCNHSARPPRTCPACDSARIRHFGAGTQAVEDALRAAFPQARPLRWDADTALDPASHANFLRAFLDGQANVLVGTQMIAKGLDLPLVTLVGVVSADMALALPDFRAAERTFQLITQVAGRAGRGLLGGRVIVQSYQPGHYAVAAAAQHDVDGFYAQEIAARQALHYPPLRRMARVLLHAEREADAAQAARRVEGWLRRELAARQMSATRLIGPVPCFHARVNRVYRWQIMLVGPDPAAVLRDLPPERGLLVDVDPADTL